MYSRSTGEVNSNGYVFATSKVNPKFERLLSKSLTTLEVMTYYLVVHTGPEQVILFRLRTGHSRLTAHMYSKFKVDEFEMCPCKADILTAKHVLQHCQLHDALRRDMWSEPMPLRDKLYCNREGRRGGGVEGVRRTAAFVRVIGISF